MITVYAERQEVGDRIVITTVSSLRAASVLIDHMEDRGTWPEGHDAIAQEGNQLFFYDGEEWEEI